MALPGRKPGFTKHMWTKAEIRKVISLWDKTSKEDLAKELNLSGLQLQYMVSILRKEGFDLPKKRKASVIMNLLQELKGEYGII